MARRKSSGLGGVLGLLVVAAAWFLTQHAKELLVVAGVGLAIWVVYKVTRPKDRGAVVRSAEGHVASQTVADPRISEVPSRAKEPMAAAVREEPPGSPVYPPTPPGQSTRTPIERRPASSEESNRNQVSTNGDEFWQKSPSAGNGLGPWIYYGTRLSAVSRSGAEPALVDPDLPADRTVRDCTVRRLDYWPTYDGASPEARGAYLHWLGTGRKDPSADVGYVFLYFYGLERRILHDAQTSQAAKDELPALQAEIERLLSIYTNSGSFQGYAGSLVDLLKYKSVPPRMYERPPPPLRGARELALEHRIALGQCSVDGKPLPAEWAFVWFISSPAACLRTPARRCPDEFRRLFVQRYGETFNEGMSLPRNRTLLKVEHRPASPTFGRGFPEQGGKLDLPDLTVLSGPIKRLQEIAETCSSELDSYSRFVRKNPTMMDSFDAIVELPFVLWPPEIRKPIEEMKAMANQEGKPFSTTFEKLRAWLPKWHVINKQKMRALHRGLGEAGLGMEPDVRFGGAMPTEASTVVIFVDDAASTTGASTAGYDAAVLTLQMSVAVAGADGHSCDEEMELLTQQLETWLHLSESERRRLDARLRLMLAEPPKLTGLKTRLEQMDPGQREAVGEFLALVALADGKVVPGEIKALEKTFKLLGLDPKSVYSAVHVAATEPVTVRPADEVLGGHRILAPPAASPAGALKLDPARVAALQADSERVAALLRPIFEQPQPEPEQVSAAVETECAEPQEAQLLGLDPESSLLVRTLIGRARWSRAELEDLAEDGNFMLDGTLEKINDAAFSKLDKPLFEGEDPIEINAEAAREVLQ